MKKILLPLLLTALAVGLRAQTPEDSVECRVRYLTTAEFQQRIARLDTNVWVYKADCPCIIDCYTTWCGPCRKLAPIMEELAAEYCGQVDFYKVDIERDRLLGQVFGAATIPTIVYCPYSGAPAITKGLMAKEAYVQIIEEFLLGVKGVKE